MNPHDILVWPDGFWCFREEFSSKFLRDDNYRVIDPESQSDEWIGYSRQRQDSKIP